MPVKRAEARLVRSIQHALEHGEFCLAYQPIVDLRTRRPVGMEALLRWPGTDIGPDIFIPIAEQAGFIRDITRHVCVLAARDFQAAPAAFTCLSINLSATDIQAAETVDILHTLLKETGDCLRLSVELSERSLIPTIDTTPAARLTIHHVGALAHALGLSIVAEGVETEAQARLLYEQGIRLAQGWLFGHPEPIETLARTSRPPRTRRSPQRKP